MIVESRTFPIGDETYRVEVHKDNARFLFRWHCSKCHDNVHYGVPTTVKELALSLALDSVFNHHAEHHATVTAVLPIREMGGL